MKHSKELLTFRGSAFVANTWEEQLAIRFHVLFDYRKIFPVEKNITMVLPDK